MAAHHFGVRSPKDFCFMLKRLVGEAMAGGGRRLNRNHDDMLALSFVLQLVINQNPGVRVSRLCFQDRQKVAWAKEVSLAHAQPKAKGANGWLTAAAARSHLLYSFCSTPLTQSQLFGISKLLQTTRPHPCRASQSSPFRRNPFIKPNHSLVLPALVFILDRTFVP